MLFYVFIFCSSCMGMSDFVVLYTFPFMVMLEQGNVLSVDWSCTVVCSYPVGGVIV